MERTERPLQRLACDRCHVQKLRCNRGFNRNGACQRCAKAGEKCTYSPPLRLGRPANRCISNEGSEATRSMPTDETQRKDRSPKRITVATAHSKTGEEPGNYPANANQTRQEVAWIEVQQEVLQGGLSIQPGGEGVDRLLPPEDTSTALPQAPAPSQMGTPLPKPADGLTAPPLTLETDGGAYTLDLESLPDVYDPGSFAAAEFHIIDLPSNALNIPNLDLWPPTDGHGHDPPVRDPAPLSRNDGSKNPVRLLSQLQLRLYEIFSAGLRSPSPSNVEAWKRAIDENIKASHDLLDILVALSRPRSTPTSDDAPTIFLLVTCYVCILHNCDKLAARLRGMVESAGGGASLALHLPSVQIGSVQPPAWLPSIRAALLVQLIQQSVREVAKQMGQLWGTLKEHRCGGRVRAYSAFPSPLLQQEAREGICTPDRGGHVGAMVASLEGDVTVLEGQLNRTLLDTLDLLNNTNVADAADVGVMGR